MLYQPFLQHHSSSSAVQAQKHVNIYKEKEFQTLRKQQSSFSSSYISNKVASSKLFDSKCKLWEGSIFERDFLAVLYNIVLQCSAFIQFITVIYRGAAFITSYHPMICKALFRRGLQRPQGLLNLKHWSTVDQFLVWWVADVSTTWCMPLQKCTFPYTDSIQSDHVF